MQVPGPFEYELATSVDHAIGLLDRSGVDARIVAGGRDPGFFLTREEPRVFDGSDDPCSVRRWRP
jgi:hypothetical protein